MEESIKITFLLALDAKSKENGIIIEVEKGKLLNIY